jgi:hypothetical protein
MIRMQFLFPYKIATVMEETLLTQMEFSACLNPREIKCYGEETWRESASLAIQERESRPNAVSFIISAS